jgi:hypothetical protein
MSKSKRSRDRRDVGEDLDVELFDEDAAPDAGGKGGKKPSLSKQLAALDGTEQAKSRKGRGQGVQSLLRFMSPVSSPATPATPVPGASAEAGAVAFVPHKLRGSALEFVNRESEKDAGLESARKHRQGKGSAKKSRTLDPDELPGEAWVFFRAAKEGENSKYVYCKAHGFKSQTKCKLSRARVKISKDKKGPFLKLSNAESHLQGCHEEWWRAVAAAARNGKDPKKTFLDLCGADTPLPRQRNISVVRTVRPGQLEKELALLVWIVRNKLPFNALNDEIGFAALCSTWDVKLRGADSIKNLAFAMHESALRDAVERIREARAYSITLDYWTASNGNKFLSITYHWTDDNWNVCAQTLDLVPIDGTASGEVTENVVSMRTDDHFGKHGLWGEALRP